MPDLVKYKEMSRRNGSGTKALILIGIGAVFLYGIYSHHDVKTKLHVAEEKSEQLRQQHDSLAAQIQVVYEHKSRLEKSLQSEKTAHKQTRDDASIEKSKDESDHKKEKEELYQRLESINQEKKLLESKNEDVGLDLDRAQEDMQVLKQEHVNSLAVLQDEVANLKRTNAELNEKLGYANMNRQEYQRQIEHDRLQLGILSEKVKNLQQQLNNKAAEDQVAPVNNNIDQPVAVNQRVQGGVDNAHENSQNVMEPMVNNAFKPVEHVPIPAAQAAPVALNPNQQPLVGVIPDQEIHPVKDESLKAGINLAETNNLAPVNNDRYNEDPMIRGNNIIKMHEQPDSQNQIAAPGAEIHPGYVKPNSLEIEKSKLGVQQQFGNNIPDANARQVAAPLGVESPLLNNAIESNQLEIQGPLGKSIQQDGVFKEELNDHDVRQDQLNIPDEKVMNQLADIENEDFADLRNAPINNVKENKEYLEYREEDENDNKGNKFALV